MVANNVRGVSHKEGGWPKEIDCLVSWEGLDKNN